MRKILEILTPENVHVEYELAGLGSRFIALIIDSLIQFGLIAIVAIGMALGQFNFEQLKELNLWIAAIGIILLFIIFFGYFILFESIINGQSPGKRIMKLRVIKQNGEPVGFWESLLRNILRIADFLPSFNLAGAAFMVFSSKYKRIGDFAANTVVIKIRKEEQLAGLDKIISNIVQESDVEKVNIYPVNNNEYNVLKEFLQRKDSLGERKALFTFHLNKYFMKKFDIEKPLYKTPNEFFEDIIRMNSR